jgi:hypothetical protein
VSSGYLPLSFYAVGRHTHSHEIGHNLGRSHDVSAAIFGTTPGGSARGACGETGATNAPPYPFQPANGSLKPTLGPMTNGVNSLILGLDTLTLRTAPAINPVVVPTNYFDLMSYCSSSPLDLWIGKFTYLGIFNSINTTFGPPAPVQPPSGVSQN